MRIETWRSNKGSEEIHHFVDGEANTYLFGFNEKLLGSKAYNKVLQIVANRLSEINRNEPAYRDWATAGDEQ